jgi:organic radical activating enzyme
MIKKSKLFIKQNSYTLRVKISALQKKHSSFVVIRNVFFAVRGLVTFVRSLFFTELNYLEFNITDHCNLNCNSCSHFSNIAIENYADIEKYEKDILRLRTFFDNIRVIRIMGGEPLLHPEVASFIQVTRKAFPRSSIRLVTNGILLPKASELFWSTCHKTDAIIDLSVYPLLSNKVKDIELLCNAHRVLLYQSGIQNHFFSFLNINGDSDMEQRFNECQKLNQDITLRDGYLYSCWMPPVVGAFNNRFDFNINVDKGIDINSSGLSGKKIIAQLKVPMQTCKWCSSERRFSSWACGKINYKNWVA